MVVIGERANGDGMHLPRSHPHSSRLPFLCVTSTTAFLRILLTPSLVYLHKALTFAGLSLHWYDYFPAPLTSSIQLPHGRAATNPSISPSSVDVMPQHDHPSESPSTLHLEVTESNKRVHDEASGADVGRNVRLDRDAIGFARQSRKQTSVPLGTGPAEGLQPLATSAEQVVPNTPAENRQSLVFSLLALNSAVRVPLQPPTAQGRLQHPRASGSGDVPDGPRRTDARPSVMCRRFTYPDTYQEALWLFDSVGTSRERRRLADYADDAPCSKRKSHTEEEETTETAWRRMELEKYYLGQQGPTTKGYGMDGADSEIQDSEANASGDPHLADTGISSRSVPTFDGEGNTKRHTGGAKPTALSVNTQLGKVDEVNQRGEMHPSVMCPARVHLYLGRPRSLQEGQRQVPCSLHPPRGLNQETKSENDVGVLDNAFRIRRPLEFANTCATKVSLDDPAGRTTLETTALDIRFRGQYLPTLEISYSLQGVSLS